MLLDWALAIIHDTLVSLLSITLTPSLHRSCKYLLIKVLLGLKLPSSGLHRKRFLSNCPQYYYTPEHRRKCEWSFEFIHSKKTGWYGWFQALLTPCGTYWCLGKQDPLPISEFTILGGMWAICGLWEPYAVRSRARASGGYAGYLALHWGRLEGTPGKAPQRGFCLSEGDGMWGWKAWMGLEKVVWRETYIETREESV